MTGALGPLENGPLPVFVIHWRSPASLLRTVEALRKQTVALRIVVLDNASPRDVLRGLEGHDFDLELMPRNLGYGGALNHALSRWLASTGSAYAVVCPHDALPRPDCVEVILTTMRRRPRAGLACAEYGVDAAPGYTLLHGYDLYPCVRSTGWCPAEFPNGTLFVVARACLEDVGLFDERYFSYGEEHDLGRRALAAGWEVGQVWDAVVENPSCAAPPNVTAYLGLRNGLLASFQRDGLAAALVRTCVIAANGVRLWLRRADAKGGSPAIRARAVRDFWLRRFGAPPELR